MSSSQRRNRINVRDDRVLAQKLKNREPFYTNHNATHGGPVTPAYVDKVIWPGIETGSKLDPEFLEICSNHVIDYVVYSYNTPIAWHTIQAYGMEYDAWIMPTAKYSATTTNHQNVLIHALKAITSRQRFNWTLGEFSMFFNEQKKA